MKLHPRNYLTVEQRRILCAALFLLLAGLAVKLWRTAHPAAQEANRRISAREDAK